MSPTESEGFPPEPGPELGEFVSVHSGIGDPPQREARENYLDALAGDIGLVVPDCPRDLLRLYALLALVAGTQVTLENVHDAWSAWRAAARPDHPALVPFGELSPEVQMLDAPYADAIRSVASHVETDILVTVSREDLRTVLGANWTSPEMRAALSRIQYAVSGSLSCPRCSGFNPNVCTCLRHCGGHPDCAGQHVPTADEEPGRG